MVRAPTPEFVRVTVCGALVVVSGWLPKFRLVEDSETTGLMPVPDKLVLTVPPVKSPVTLISAERLPVAVGVKVALMVQEELGASVEGDVGQSLVCAKSPLFVPEIAMPVTAKGDSELFVSERTFGTPVTPTIRLPKEGFRGEKVTPGLGGVCSRTETPLEMPIPPTAKSSKPSPLKSPTTRGKAGEKFEVLRLRSLGA
jgi:hypothetical protein